MKKPAMDLSGSEDEDFAPRKPAKKAPAKKAATTKKVAEKPSVTEPAEKK